jgi:trk system potassium uptake protein
VKIKQSPNPRDASDLSGSSSGAAPQAGHREEVRQRAAARPGSSEAKLRVLALRLAALLVVVMLSVLEHGFYQPLLPSALMHVFQVLVLALYAIDIWRRGRRSLHPMGEQGFHWDDWTLFTLATVGAAGNLLLLLFGWLETRSAIYDFADGVWWLFEVAVSGLLAIELWRLNVGLSRKLHRVGLLFPLSFLSLVVIGTLLLMVECAVPQGSNSLSFIDALFMSTSAVCVTGLAVTDTAQLAPFGQIVICILFQIGGLGIIVFGSVMAMMFGARLSLRENLTLSQMLNDAPLEHLTRFVRFIVLSTLGIELIGALLLMPMWDFASDGSVLTMTDRFGYSLFHSISAFCNAGFSLQSDSLIGYRYSFFVHAVFVGLIMLGGIGFPVILNVFTTIKWKLRRRDDTVPMSKGALVSLAQQRLTLHTKVVLTTTAVLYLIGVVGIAAGQLKTYAHPHLNQGQTANQVAPDDLTAGEVGQVLADASFMSVSARTAGFNNMPIEELEPASRFTMILTMMIGASPGGTGGGMKTTTIAVLMLGIGATMRRRKTIQAFGRRISDELIRKAGTLAMCFVLLVSVSTLLLLLSEPFPFEVLLFEVVSAANTVGLSMGITSELSTFGKIVIIVTMFLGRIGPLAMLVVLTFGASGQRPYEYAREDVVIG